VYIISISNDNGNEFNQGSSKMIESTDRAAWTQYEEDGMGSGFHAFKHKQPNCKSNKAVDRVLRKDYYVKTNGEA
jgi:hypothetical protein